MSDLGSYDWMRHVMGDDEAEQVYVELCSGGSANARAIAGAASYRAREYWPDFFSIANVPALAACARLFDNYFWLSPTLVERAVEQLRGRRFISPMDIVEAAQLLDDVP